MSERDGNTAAQPSEPGALRIGDAEREQALTALGEHLSAGRLDIDEFGERSAKVTASRTRQELSGLFADLPDPRPDFGGRAPAPRPEPDAPAQAETLAPDVRMAGGRPLASAARRVAASVMGVSWVIGMVLAVSTGHWWLIFLPMGLSAVFGGAWGKGWRDEHDHHGRLDERHERRRDRRRERGWDDDR